MSHYRKLGKPTDQRVAMLRAMTTYLLENGQIKNTVSRAQDVAPIAEKMIPLATAGGSGIQKAEKSLREHCPAADWKPGKLLNGGNIEAWVKEMQ